MAKRITNKQLVEIAKSLPRRRPRWLGRKPLPSVALAMKTARGRAQLRMGVREEMEHTDRPVLALIIALDHLEEDAIYYTKLRKCFK